MQTLEEWIEEDIALSKVLTEIQSLEKSEWQQAEIAFDKLCDLYDLPKLPEDLERFYEYYEKLGVDEPRSVYEEFALIKFLEPDDDPRGLILAAIFHVKNNFGVNINEIFIKQFGRLPQIKQLGIKGERLNTEIIFINENENWVDLGCTKMLKVI